MNSKLRKGERCPIHKSYFCCGRERAKRKQLESVIRVMDDTHPRGYREECSEAELRRRKDALIVKGEGCLYCSKPFEDYRQVELAHKQSKGMGGAKHDDHRDNLGLAHRWCNRANGSKSQEVA